MDAVKSLVKALEILECVSASNGSPSVGHISAELGLNRTTTHRLVKTLESKGYLAYQVATKGYQIGLSFLPLTARLLDGNKLRVESLPHLQALALKTGERINLGILHDGEVLYIGGIEKPSLPLAFSRFGNRAPAHCCSLGKIILAYLDEPQVNAILTRRPLLRLTPNTITDTKRFKKHLGEIRAQGYAIDNAEHVVDSYCVSALIRSPIGGPLGAISISGGDLDKIKQQIPDLRQTAELISHLLEKHMRLATP